MERCVCGGGERGSGFLLFLSAPPQPTHDLSWGLTIRNRRLLGPFKPIQASTVDGELPLGRHQGSRRLHQGPAF